MQECACEGLGVNLKFSEDLSGRDRVNDIEFAVLSLLITVRLESKDKCASYEVLLFTEDSLFEMRTRSIRSKHIHDTVELLLNIIRNLRYDGHIHQILALI